LRAEKGERDKNANTPEFFSLAFLECSFRDRSAGDAASKSRAI
jgi:hypothetical protein